MIVVKLPQGEEVLVAPESASRFIVYRSNSFNEELTFDLGKIFYKPTTLRSTPKYLRG